MSIGAAPAILDGNILKYMDYQALEALDASIKQDGVFPPVLFGRAAFLCKKTADTLKICFKGRIKNALICV